MSEDEKATEIPIVSAESIDAVEVCDAALERLFAELADRGITPEQAAEGLRKMIEQHNAELAAMGVRFDLLEDGDI